MGQSSGTPLRLIQAAVEVQAARQRPAPAVEIVVLDHNTRRKHSRAQAGAAAGGGPAQTCFSQDPINDRQLREIVSDAWLAIHRANQHGGTIYPHTPFLFHRAGCLVRLVIGEFGPRLKRWMRSRLRIAGAHGRLASGAEDADVETSPRETLRATCWLPRLTSADAGGRH